jgi:predicted transcriptional regulator
MEFTQDSTVSKLIVLFVLDKIEIPLTEKSILDICYGKNNWLNYMDCKVILFDLIEAGFIYKTDGNLEEDRYTITYSGRACLDHFYERIPADLQKQIIAYLKENRIHFKRAQEYVGDYNKNTDGSYTVVLKIRSTMINEPMFELKIKAPTRQSAEEACKKWKQKAPNIYEHIFENLISID